VREPVPDFLNLEHHVISRVGQQYRSLAPIVDNRIHHTAARMQSQALLTGRIFDDRGNRMSPSHARKKTPNTDTTCPRPYSTAQPTEPDPCAECLRLHRSAGDQVGSGASETRTAG
jgi:hypothetical protein